MARGINLSFLADVSGFLRGTDSVEGALEDVGGSLDELARESQATSDAMTGDLRDVQTAGSTAAADLESSFRDAFSDVKRHADQASDDVDASVRDAGSKGKISAKEAGSEIGSELSANIGEQIGAGTTDLADVLRGTVGGLAAVPGLGLAAIGAGLMAGIVGGFLNKGKEQQEKAKAAGAAMFQAFQDGMLDAQERQDNLVAALGVDDMSAALTEVASMADKLNVSKAQVLHALLYPDEPIDASLAGAIKRAQDRLDNLSPRGAAVVREQLTAAAEAGRDISDAIGTANAAIDDGRGKVDLLNAALERTPKVVKVKLDIDSREAQAAITRNGFRWDGS